MRLTRFLAGAFALACMTATATAADVPRSPYNPTPVRAAAIFDWSGFYIGANAGYGWKDSSAGTAALPAPFPPLSLSASANGDGWLYGVEVSALRQFSSGMVLGVAADWTWADLSGSSVVNLNGPPACGFCGPVAGSSYSHKLDQFGTARIVAGYAFDRWLPYLTAGVAYGKGKATATDGTTSITAKADHIGYAVGAGMKYALSPNVIASFEYLYADLGTKDYSFGAFGPVSVTARTNVDAHLLRAGVAVKF